MVKKLPAPAQQVPNIDVPLPDGRRVVLNAHAFGLAVRYGMVKAQLSEEERQAFDVVSNHSEYSAMEKAVLEGKNITKTDGE